MFSGVRNKNETAIKVTPFFLVRCPLQVKRITSG
jgi:hypothetical protein